jgi:mannosyltransferase OCH1-like enzyme
MGRPSIPVRIPKVIVQYWHDSDAIPADVRECLDSWEPLIKQGFMRSLFDDHAARRFISIRFGRLYVAAFDRCHHPAMRCDYFRLCYMFECGGFYVDADEFYQGADCQALVCDNNLKIQPLCYDQLTGAMVETAVFLGSRAHSPAWTFYINNNPLVAPPGHPVLRLALDRSTRLLLSSGRNQLDIQSTTGPGNFTASLVRHAIDSDLGGKARDFTLLTNWDSVSVSRWPLSYREDDRNWRLWRPN